VAAHDPEPLGRGNEQLEQPFLAQRRIIVLGHCRTPNRLSVANASSRRGISSRRRRVDIRFDIAAPSA
jgi:hypothetical protein